MELKHQRQKEEAWARWNELDTAVTYRWWVETVCVSVFQTCGKKKMTSLMLQKQRLWARQSELNCKSDAGGCAAFIHYLEETQGPTENHSDWWTWGMLTQHVSEFLNSLASTGLPAHTNTQVCRYYEREMSIDPSGYVMFTEPESHAFSNAFLHTCTVHHNISTA